MLSDGSSWEKARHHITSGFHHPALANVMLLVSDSPFDAFAYCKHVTTIPLKMQALFQFLSA